MRLQCGAALCQGDDHIVQLQSADDILNDCSGHGGRQQRERHMAEDLPLVPAVERRRLIIHGRNILQTRQIDDHGDADILPAVDERDDDLAARSVRQPVDRVLPEILEDLIDDAVVELEEEIHDVAHQKAGDHDRQIDDRPHRVADLEFAVEEQRQRQTEYVLQQRRAEAIEHGVPE